MNIAAGLSLLLHLVNGAKATVEAPVLTGVAAAAEPCVLKPILTGVATLLALGEIASWPLGGHWARAAALGSAAAKK